MTLEEFPFPLQRQAVRHISQTTHNVCTYTQWPAGYLQTPCVELGTYLLAVQVPIIDQEPPWFSSAADAQSFNVLFECCNLIFDCFGTHPANNWIQLHELRLLGCNPRIKVKTQISTGRVRVSVLKAFFFFKGRKQSSHLSDHYRVRLDGQNSRALEVV